MQDKPHQQNRPDGTAFPETEPRAIGAVKRVRIRCISETGWFDTPTLLADLKSTGQDLNTLDQYDLRRWPPFGALHPENAGGSSALIEAEENDGTLRRCLFDSGWNPEWMDKRFAEEGVDKMLQRGEIEFLVISHEHFDHFWGIGSSVQHCPDIPIYVPEGFHQAGFDLIEQVGHTGPVHTVPPGMPIVPFPGLAITHFPMKTLGNVEGENVLYMNIMEKGLAMITGCGHGGVLQLLDYGKRAFRDADKIHAVYGGLHISPFGEWNETLEATVDTLSGYGIEHFGCNHCTGEKTVQRMIELGMPVTRGSARHGSRSDLYLGNGDVFEV
uniref:7,8-dihydropterin-6-yl-methyl-4-(Beta-D-ribofuranosyl)aminobenzene 5'-phosphate synthase n=1 Tax=Candidatus Kentrum eta TaxID=2126337 RepID=A0A450UA86_9GAMM|nr:MAG: 7,8-dihydropterin-6-yl-methyl-4-(beta-D-ribofuranosyl)aminobenzene 5'-phosphate synthase [Candidatus Kentron sp. H]VFJ89783.1 MAG: 7,8-dihydropterin-6-yl-methyl-4-(beta-D-ribofuranosyl)aminobenzene 5'-phosphate synthase [Candidatus Kentron sp. H]VFJ97171.1 MAG: 7,8-dihydropterin-6-yl-methyl-4-(beta-D-ribofuranosyl)aminobenzene 5'-phosphate synthase [Candidatus Kentron sp. H]